MTHLEKPAEVLPGRGVEISVAELQEGGRVGVLVRPWDDTAPAKVSILAFLDTLPEGPRAFSTWDRYEESRRREREAWDR